MVLVTGALHQQAKNLDSIVEKNVLIRGNLGDFCTRALLKVEANGTPKLVQQMNQQMALKWAADQSSWIQSVNESLEAETRYLKVLYEAISALEAHVVCKDDSSLGSEVQNQKSVRFTGYDTLNQDVHELKVRLNSGANQPSKDSCLEELKATVDNLQKRFEPFNEEVRNLRLTWTSAHTALMEDMRELMARFNQSPTPTSGSPAAQAAPLTSRNSPRKARTMSDVSSAQTSQPSNTFQSHSFVTPRETVALQGLLSTDSHLAAKPAMSETSSETYLVPLCKATATKETASTFKIEATPISPRTPATSTRPRATSDVATRPATSPATSPATPTTVSHALHPLVQPRVNRFDLQADDKASKAGSGAMSPKSRSMKTGTSHGLSVSLAAALFPARERNGSIGSLTMTKDETESALSTAASSR